MLLELLKAVILGVVQGVTEFLPISSTGHLILVNQFASFSPGFTEKFDIIIQLGSILAVVALFRHRLLKMEALPLWKKTVAAVIPALFFGALFDDLIENLLYNPTVVAVALVLGGIILLAVESRKREARIGSVAEVTYKTAILIGLVQCIAMVPGTSRSAATIIGAMLLGCSRIVAVEFSFFLAIPTMCAATGYSFLKIGLDMTRQEGAILAVGFLVSFLVAWAVIKGFIRYVSTRDFKPFGWYRIVVGAAILSYFGFFR